VLALVRIVATYSVYSHTFDEPRHIAAGIERWSVGRYTLDEAHPPLARVILAIGPYATGARSVGEERVWREASAVMRTGGGYEQNLTLGRMGVLPFFLLACWIAWWWGRRVAGVQAAAFGVVIFTLVPAVVGHAGLATTDVPLLAMLMAACAAWLTWTEEPRSLGRAGLLGVALGAAVATKFSAIPYFAAVALLSLFFLRPWRALTPLELWRAIGVAAVAAFVVLWASHGFSVGRVAGVVLPFPEFFVGLRQIAQQGAGQHFSYLLGHPSTRGNVAFFPVALLVKTPLALWVLVGLAGVWAVQWWRRSGKTDHGAFMQLPKREIAEVGVVCRARMRGKECGTGTVPLFLSLDARALTEHRDPAVGERICKAALGYQQGCARIPLQILGVLGQCTDEENRVSILKRDGHERAVGVALRLQGKRA
jgi:hypothetical protein